jgi:hypothetical protein
VNTLTLIGYWRDDDEHDWPDARDFVDESWDARERERVASYLKSGTVPWIEAGYSRCRLCGKLNGLAEFTDGVFVWPEGLSHYVADHSVRLPVRVVEHILTRLDDFEEREIVDPEWWRTVRPEHA